MKFSGKANGLIFLVGITLFLFIIFLFNRGNELLSIFLPNIIAGFVGSMVTIYVLDGMLGAEKIRAEDEYREIVNSRIGYKIGTILNLFSEMVKGVVNVDALLSVKSYSDLFSDQNIGQLKYFNFYAKPAELSFENWLEYSKEVLSNSERELNQIIDSFFPYLDPEFVKEINALTGSLTYSATKSAHKVIRVSELRNPIDKSFIVFRAPVQELRKMFQLLEKIRIRLEKAQKEDFKLSFRSDILDANLVPKPGSCRLNEPLAPIPKFDSEELPPHIRRGNIELS